MLIHPLIHSPHTCNGTRGEPRTRKSPQISLTGGSNPSISALTPQDLFSRKVIHMKPRHSDTLMSQPQNTMLTPHFYSQIKHHSPGRILKCPANNTSASTRLGQDFNSDETETASCNREPIGGKHPRVSTGLGEPKNQFTPTR